MILHDNERSTNVDVVVAAQGHTHVASIALVSSVIAL